ncbi:MAG: hypothetical protein ACYC3W_10530, partial [Candidatus Nanopelagicales bacterium]
MRVQDILNLAPEELHQLYDAISRDKSLYAQVVMGHIVRDIPDMHRDVYGLMDRATGVDRLLKYVALVLYRGAAKSTIKTICAAHDVCHQQEPMFLFLSEAEDQSIRDLVALQDEIECNEVLQLLYGELKGARLWNKSECEFANGIYAAAKGWRAKIRGIKWKIQRPTKIWLDDFEGEENTKDSKKREEVAQWIDGQVMPAGD